MQTGCRCRPGVAVSNSYSNRHRTPSPMEDLPSSPTFGVQAKCLRIGRGSA